MGTQSTKEWLESLNDDQVTEEQAEILIDELAKELAIAEATPKPINDEYAAVRRALENAKNKPQGHIRDFNYKTYLQTDEQAKNLMVSYLTNKGYEITRDKETYGTDLEVSKDGTKSLFEVEISSLDFTKEFPYPMVSFLGRKKKYHDNEGSFHYVIISKNGQYALTAKSEDIFKEENYTTKECTRDGITGVDEFYYLPVSEVKFFKISLTK